MKKVYCIGEVLVDFIGQPEAGIVNSKYFAKHPGGAPANVAAAIAKLGGNSYFLGQVGSDNFGSFLVASLQEVGIDTSFVERHGKTTLAFVAIDGFGEREFEFYRGNDSEYKLPESFSLSVDSIIHFGSATALLGGKLKESYFQLLDYATGNGNFISFDPNFREDLVSPDLVGEYVHDCRTFISCSSLVKLNKSEAQLISGEDDISAAADAILRLGTEVVIITLGEKGALLCTNSGQKIIPSKLIKQVDSTGAGDAFIGAILFKLSQNLDPNWEVFISFANLVGAYTCTSFGAIRAMPYMRDFLSFVNQ